MIPLGVINNSLPWKLNNNWIQLSQISPTLVMYSSSCFLSSEWLSPEGQRSDVEGQNASSEFRHPAIKFNTNSACSALQLRQPQYYCVEFIMKSVLLRHVHVCWDSVFFFFFYCSIRTKYTLDSVLGCLGIYRVKKTFSTKKLELFYLQLCKASSKLLAL